MKNKVSVITKGALMSLCLLALAACSALSESERLPPDAAQALADATEVTAYSLEPDRAPDAEYLLHGYQLLGEVQLSGQEARTVKQEYRDSLQEYQEERKAGHGSAPHCQFQPRHALRITTPDHHVYDYIACFSCGMIELYKDDTHYWSGQIRGTAVKLNEILKDNTIQLAKPR